MADSTVIGRSTFIRGRVHGTGDLEVLGRIEGELSASGEVVVENTGLVAADVTARRIVVRGAVRGNLVAEEALVIDAQARVVGDLRAPRITIAQGGLVRGHVQTTGSGSTSRASTSRAHANAPSRTNVPVSRTPAAPVRDVVSAKPVSAPAKPAPAPVAPPVVKATANGTPARATTAPSAARNARPGPPPPVVPVLKKGTKAVQKKRG